MFFRYKNGGTKIIGEWISYYYLSFDLGKYSEFSSEKQDFNFNIFGIEVGENVLSWKIMYSNGNNNILTNKINTQHSEIEYLNSGIINELEIGNVQLNGSQLTDRVLPKDNNQLQIELNLSSNISIDKLNISIQKQVDFGIFETIAVSINSRGNIIVVNLPSSLDIGLYRIKFL